MEPLTQRISAFLCWRKSGCLCDAEACCGVSLAGTPQRAKVIISGSTYTGLRSKVLFDPLNAELNPKCHLLVLSRAHHILHSSGMKVNPEKMPEYFANSVSFFIVSNSVFAYNFLLKGARDVWYFGGHQNGTSFISPFWRVEFWSGLWIFGEFARLCFSVKHGDTVRKFWDLNFK